MAPPYGKQATTSEQKAKGARDDAARAPVEQSEIQVCDSILDLGHRRLHRTTQKEQVVQTPTRTEECFAPGDEPGLARLPIEFEI